MEELYFNLRYFQGLKAKSPIPHSSAMTQQMCSFWLIASLCMKSKCFTLSVVIKATNFKIVYSIRGII